MSKRTRIGWQFAWVGIVLLAWLGVFGPVAAGGGLLMARSSQSFPETMLALQESIKAHGYTVARVQRVDIGLTTAGFDTDKYRIVFYGNADEVRQLAESHPQLVPLLPPSFSIFAEGDQTLVVAMNPSVLADQHPELAIQFARWESDVRSILADIRSAE